MHRGEKTYVFHSRTLAHIKYYVIGFLMLPLQEMMMVFQDLCTKHMEQQKSWMVEWRMKGRTEPGDKREMDLFGGFHRVRSRKWASAKVCLSQHETGDDGHPSRNNECQISVFCFSLRHTQQISHRLPNEVKNTSCHTCIHGKRAPHADNANSFPPLSVSLLLISLCLYLKWFLIFLVCVHVSAVLCVLSLSV